jgi:hypothetical protein
VASADAGDGPPFGAVGLRADRNPQTGQFVTGNRAALVVGARSLGFWRAADDARREIREAILTDAGFTPSDAPRALLIAADGVAQAALLRDASFARVVESGGPLTTTGRTRRAFAVWQAAADRAERYMRLIGLKRQPKPAPSLAELLAAQPDEPEDQESATELDAAETLGTTAELTEADA